MIIQDVIAGNSYRTTHWAQRVSVGEKTIQRDLKRLREADLIRFEGPDKTGRYVLTETGKHLLNNPQHQP